MFRPFKKIKFFLPKTLFGRSLIILIAPVLLIQGVMTYVFIDRHLTKVTELLAQNIAGSVSASLDLMSGKGYEEIESASLIPFVREHFNLEMSVSPPTGKKVSDSSYGWIEQYLAFYIQRQVTIPFRVKVGNTYSHVTVYALNKDLIFTFETKRLFSKTTEILLWWALGTPVLFLFIAIIFMRNQVRPLRRLSEGVEAFGKGQDVEELHPSGAREIRKVAEAFNAMRERIHRQIEQRTHMLAGVSHDLRTPLARMSLQMAVMPPSKDLEALQEDLREMEQMLTSYLSFARGEIEEATREISVRSLLKSVVRGIPCEKIKVSWPEKDFIIQGRKNALTRCIGNLIQNGVRYASHVWVKTRIIEKDLHILVEDDGPGIPESQREEVFKPFMRLEESRNNETGGTGLGLAIARDIARSHGGDIVLENSKNNGLVARLILPL